jgi:PAS domain S-box-containing protein
MRSPKNKIESRSDLRYPELTAGLREVSQKRELYRRAVTQLQEWRKNQKPEAGLTKPAVDSHRLLHELEVHQLELEMQNDELQKARDELEVALDQYTGLYDFAPAGYFTLTADGTIHMVNLTGACLVGIERSRLLGRSFGLLISAELRPVFNSFLKRVFAGHTKQSCEFVLLSRGQPPRTVNIEAQCLLNGQDCRAAVVDITEHKRVEDKVRVSEIRYRRLFEAAQDGVLLLDPGTCKITDANPYMTKLLGYPHDQLVGKELFEIGLLNDEAASRAMFRKLKRKHEVRYQDLPLETQGGRRQEVEVVANLYAENGHAIIQCNIRDITERKRAEEMLHRNEALFSALIAQVPVGVYVVDAGLRLQRVNPRAQPVFSKVHPLIGRDFSEIIHIIWPRRVADQVMEHFRHTLKTGEPYQSPNFAERRRDIGVNEIYEWQIQRVTLPAGEYGVVCFFTNITERKQAEEAQRRIEVLAASNLKLEQEIVRRRLVQESLKKSEQQQSLLLEQSRQMQEQLRKLSHRILHAQEEERRRISRELHDEIAQTLVSINSHLEALTRDAASNVRGLPQKIKQTQRQVARSVDIVHRFARQLRPPALDDLGLVAALHAFMKEFSKRTGIHVHFKTFTSGRIKQLNSATRTVFYRVAQESLTNVARHAMASRVEVSFEKLRGAICLKIKDDGKSFQAQRVMQSKHNPRLGLLGMRERLEMVGGTFGVESAPGKGTIIRAQIPFANCLAGGKLVRAVC